MPTKPRKNNNPTIKKTNRTKTPRIWQGEYYDQKQRCYRPYFEGEIEELLREFGDNPDSLRIEDFYTDLHMDGSTFYELLQRKPDLKKAHEYAMTRIGARRERGALFKTMDASTVHKSLGHYWTVFREMEEWRAKLKEQANGDKNPKIEVIIPPFKQDKE